MTTKTTSNKQRVTLFVNPDVLTHARAQAIVEGRSLTALVERSLLAYLPKKTIIKKVVIKTSSD